MTKHYFKRSLAMLLTILMVIATVPIVAVPVFAVSSGDVTGLTDTNIGLSCSGDSNYSWTATDKTVKGYILTRSKDIASTLTITNNYSQSMTLKFDYTLVTTGANYIKIDGTQVTADGSFEKELEVGASVIVEMKTKRSSLQAKETSITMTDVRMFDKNAKTNVTFEAVQNGSYTVDETEIMATTVVTHTIDVPYVVKATPASGYKFNGWWNVDTNELLSADAEANLNIASDCKIAPKFVSDSAVIYEVGCLYFADLDKAVAYAQANNKTLITLVADAILSGQHTIPAGITLLIPFDEEGTLYTDAPGNYAENTSYPASTPFRTLTMAPGSSLIVNGTVSVSGKHYTASSAVCCKPAGPYGHIKMENGSNITINDGAKLYAWGYITGDGNIYANSGANVYEYFQIVDWRGASKLMSLYMNLELVQGEGYKKKVFPFHQYYVQNIEASLTLKYGAKENALVTITASGNPVSCTIPFIGEGGMFQLGSDGSITKRFDSETSKLVVDISGTASLSSIALSVSGYNIDSSDFVLPINGNIDINIKSGTTTITEDVAFLPGVVMTIDEGAELKVAKGAALYVYDAKTWDSSYANGTNALPYSPTRKNPIHHTNAGVSAKVDINGKLTVEGEVNTTYFENEETGELYAANICSSKGTGIFVQMVDVGTTEVTYQYIQSSDEFAEITVSSALLRNAIADEDGYYYTFTVDAEANTTFYYVQGVWTTEVPVKLSFVVDGTTTSWLWVAQNGSYTIPTTVPTKNNFTFANWTDGTHTYAAGSTIEIGETDVTLTASWKANEVTVTFKPNGGMGNDVTQKLNYNSSSTLTANAFTRKYYTFNGWNTVADGSGTSYTDEQAVTLTESITLYAQWKADVYTVIWYNNDGKTVLKTSEWKPANGAYPSYDGETPTYVNPDSAYNYTFAGWDKKVDEANKTLTFTAKYTSTQKTFTVTWKNYDGSLLETDTNVPYGTIPSYDGATPAKPGDAQYSYTFSGWSPEISQVTSSVTYTAQFKESKNTYSITYDANGGVGTMDPTTGEYGITVNVSSNAFTNEGHYFLCWNTRADGTGYDYDFGSEIELKESITLYAQWKVLTYTVIWNNYDGSELYRTTYKYGENPIGSNDYVGDTPTQASTTTAPYYSYRFNGWEKDYENSYSTTTVYYATFSELREKWHTDDDGTSYYEVGEKKYVSSWAKIDGDYYYFDAKGYIVTEPTRIPYPSDLLPQYKPDEEDSIVNKKGQSGYLEEVGEYPDDTSAIFYFDSVTGKFMIDYCGFHTGDNGEYRWIENGMVIWHAGLVEIGDNYYYFKRTGMVKNGEYYVADTNGLLPAAKYNFDDDGKLIQLSGICEDPFNSGVLRYYEGYSAVYYAGLIEVDGYWYYVNEYREVVKNGIYLVKKKNGIELEENERAWCSFNEYGQLDYSKNGLVFEPNGDICYYEEGDLVFKGLVQAEDGSYYYINWNGKAVKNSTCWVSKTNGLVKSGLQRTFDADGKMVVKSGLQNFNNTIVYYENDDIVVAPEGQNVKRTLEDGTVIIINEYGVAKKLAEKNGLVFESNGDICYYENGELVFKGLIQDEDGNYYYINWNGKAVKDTTCWVSKTNGLVKSGLQRTFDADGKMVVKSGLQSFNNTTVYYENDDIVVAPKGQNVTRTLEDGTVIIINEYGVVHYN